MKKNVICVLKKEYYRTDLSHKKFWDMLDDEDALSELVESGEVESIDGGVIVDSYAINEDEDMDYEELRLSMEE